VRPRSPASPLFALLLAIALPAAAFAQNSPPDPAPEATPAPQPTDPVPPADPAPTLDETLDLIRAAAKAHVIDVTATVTSEDGSGPEKAEKLTLHLDATGPEPRLRLDFGGFRIAAAQRRITAARDDAPDKVVQTEGDTRLSPRELLALMPALPLPHLPLVLGEARWQPSDAAFCLGATWTGVEREPAATPEAPALLKVSGASRRGPVWMWIDPATSRIVRMEASLSRPRGGSRTLKVEFAPAPPLERADWTLDVAGRQRVQTLAALRPAPKPLAVGDSADSLPLLDEAFSPASLPGVLREARVRLPEPRGPVAAALLVFRLPAEDSGDAAIREELTKLSTTLVDARREARSSVAGAKRRSADCPVIVVGVVDVKEFARPRLAAFAAAWEDARPKDDPAWPLVSWSVGSAPLERLTAATTGPAVVIVGENSIVTSVEPASANAAWKDLMLKALGEAPH
jgi:hypothetical protein